MSEADLEEGLKDGSILTYRVFKVEFVELLGEDAKVTLGAVY